MTVILITALVMIAAGFGVVFGGWLVNNAFRQDAENGNAVLIGGKIYALTPIEANNKEASNGKIF